MRFFSQIAALTILAGGAALHADTFRYDLNFDLPGVATASATFDSPAFITVDTTVAATGSSSVGPVLAVGVYVVGDCPFSDSFACFAIEETAPAGQRLFFSSLPTSTGTFFDVFGDGTVTITDLGSTSASPVPEPGTLALLGTGVLAGAGALRRRLE